MCKQSQLYLHILALWSAYQTSAEQPVRERPFVPNEFVSGFLDCYFAVGFFGFRARDEFGDK